MRHTAGGGAWLLAVVAVGALADRQRSQDVSTVERAPPAVLQGCTNQSLHAALTCEAPL